jgi:hypothetical protein
VCWRFVCGLLAVQWLLVSLHAMLLLRLCVLSVRAYSCVYLCKTQRAALVGGSSSATAKARCSRRCALGDDERTYVQVHARLIDSPRAVKDPTKAQLFHIPFYSWQYGHPRNFGRYRECGVDYVGFGDVATKLWHWLLQQVSFQASDCSDHFIILAEVRDAIQVVRFGPDCGRFVLKAFVHTQCTLSCWWYIAV